MKIKLLSFLIGLASCACLQPTPAPGAVFTVTDTTDSDSGSLRATVAGAGNGDTIVFSPGLSGGTITLASGQITLANSVTIDASALPGGMVISGNHASRIFQISANATVTLNALTLVKGYTSADVGGAIRNDGTLTVANSSISNNLAQGGNGVTPGSGNNGGAGLGGGIFSDDPVLALTNSDFTGNVAQGGNGGNGEANGFGSNSGGNGGGPNGGAGGVTTGASGGFGGGGGGGAASPGGGGGAGPGRPGLTAARAAGRNIRFPAAAGRRGPGRRDLRLGGHRHRQSMHFYQQ